MEAEIKKIKYEKNYKFFLSKMFRYQLFTSLSNLFETFINFSILVFFFKSGQSLTHLGIEMLMRLQKQDQKSIDAIIDNLTAFVAELV